MTTANKSECINGLISAAGVFAVCFAVNSAAMKMGLDELYTATKDVWRPEEQMMDLMGWCLARGILVSLMIAGIYRQWRATVKTGKTGTATCNWRKSIKFGLFFGVLLGITEASFWVYLPIPAEIAQWWLGTSIVCGIGWGIVLEFLWRKLPVAK